MSDLVTRMKVYRERLSMSQSELADRVGVRRETIVRLEKGQYNPSLKLAMDISKEFQVSVEDVFFFVEAGVDIYKKGELDE
ncbi:helix-turn-helix transcriptional regulator [Roseburia hominis]